MIKFARRSLLSLGAIVGIGAGPALGQTVAGRAGPSSNFPGAAITPGAALSSYQSVRQPTQAPLFHLFGIPVVIAAPVDAPYNSASAYSTYAGQPGYGPNAVLAASVGGQAP